MGERRAGVGASLHQAYPPPERPLFVTHDELAVELAHIETKIENSQLRTRIWVLLGVLAIISALGGSWVSIMTKLDSITDTKSTVDQRRPWMLRQDQRDDQQDRALQGVAPDYQPLPYLEPPE